MYVVSPVRTVAAGRNGPYAQEFKVCSDVPERGLFGTPSATDVVGATLSLVVCDTCGESRLFASPSELKAMLDGRAGGVSHVVAPGAPYR